MITILSLPVEILWQIDHHLDICSSKCLYNSCKFFNASNGLFREKIDFTQVPVKFRCKIKNYDRFCTDAKYINFSNTNITEKDLVRIILDHIQINFIDASSCHLIKPVGLLTKFASKFSKLKMCDRKIYLKLFSDKGRLSSGESFAKVFGNDIRSNLIPTANYSYCQLCGSYCTETDLNEGWCANCVKIDKCKTCHAYHSIKSKCCVCGKYNCRSCLVLYQCSICPKKTICFECKDYRS